jgi:hypothetical protein
MESILGASTHSRTPRIVEGYRETKEREVIETIEVIESIKEATVSEEAAIEALIEEKAVIPIETIEVIESIQEATVSEEAQRRRLALLEQASGLRQRAAMQVVSIVFEGWEATIAEGPDGFICHRRADEDLADFEERAQREVLASGGSPRGVPPPILIFKGDRNSQMNSTATA